MPRLKGNTRTNNTESVEARGILAVFIDLDAFGSGKLPDYTAVDGFLGLVAYDKPAIENKNGHDVPRFAATLGMNVVPYNGTEWWAANELRMKGSGSKDADTNPNVQAVIKAFKRVSTTTPTMAPATADVKPTVKGWMAK